MSGFTVVLRKTNHASSSMQSCDSRKSSGVFTVNNHAVSIVRDGFSLSADLTESHNGNIYIEKNNNPQNRSFVISFGWCYQRGSTTSQLKENEMIELLRSHRSKTTPDIDELSGIYSILSYDHLSETLWICTDMWAQHGFYYGSDANNVVASSQASVVANTINASIDGISYLSLLRNTGTPPGRTFYCDVWRATCGKALHLDMKSRKARLVQIQPLYQPPERISFKEAVDQLIDVLFRVCPLAAGEPSTRVDLTGGNDSRLMAAALSSSPGSTTGHNTTFRVVGEENHPDVIIARQIANKLGWILERGDRVIHEKHAPNSLLDASILSDGNHLPINVHNRVTHESTLWGPLGGLVGSIGGELFRDFFWRHEFMNMGRTSRVNFDALLKHRLYASDDVDVAQISNGQLTLDDHNSSLLNPYRMIAASMPDVTNVYKLDLIYLHKLMNTSYCWILSDVRKLILPFLTHEVTRVSLRVPWEFRAHRKLVTTAIEKMSPTLSSIPTDTGAPMKPLRLSTLGVYSRYAAHDLWTMYRRHFSKTTSKQGRATSSIPAEWLNLFKENRGAQKLSNIPSSIRGGKEKRNHTFSAAECREIHTLLMIQSLTTYYKGITPALSFVGNDASFAETTCPLL